MAGAEVRRHRSLCGPKAARLRRRDADGPPHPRLVEPQKLADRERHPDRGGQPRDVEADIERLGRAVAGGRRGVARDLAPGRLSSRAARRFDVQGGEAVRVLERQLGQARRERERERMS